MNKREFRNYMLSGLGRCAMELRDEKRAAELKADVLWGCLNACSFDEQSEGSRSDYLYRLLSIYNDTEYFLPVLIDVFHRLRPESDVKLRQLAELLSRFSADGYSEAKEALLKKYGELLLALTKKRVCPIYDYTRDALEVLCVELVNLGGEEELVRTVSDLGGLFLKNHNYGASDFDWYCVNAEGTFGKRKFLALLKREAKRSEGAAAFYGSLSSAEAVEKPVFSKVMEVPSVGELVLAAKENGQFDIGKSVRFAKGATEEEALALAKEIISESDLKKKARLLSAFSYRGKSFPLSHEILIEYAASKNPLLCETALGALTNCRSNEVREYAKKLLLVGEHREDALIILIRNYTPEIKEFLLRELNKACVYYLGELDLHGVIMTVTHAHEMGVRLPKEFFLLVYEKALCSRCRYRAVRILSKHRWLPREIIEECRYDSSSDIVDFVNRYYPAKRA